MIWRRRGRIREDSAAFTMLLGSLAALPPLGIDMSLPALTNVAAELRASPASVGLTLSLFLAGFAASQLVLGPLSDAFGRRPVLLGGLALFVSGGIGCTVATTIGGLIAWRLIEGSGAAAGTVMAFAMVRDLFEGHQARRKLAYVATVLPVAPMLAPSIGSVVLLVAGWRAIYGLLVLAGALLFTVVLLWTGETHARRERRPSVLQAYRRVLSHRSAGGFAAANALSFGMLFAWVSGSPLVLMQDGGVRKLGYAALFACTSAGLLAGAWVSGRLAARHVPFWPPLRLGLAGGVVASLAALALLLVAPLHPATLVPLIVLAMVCRGMATPTMTHAALEPLPAIAGVVSAIIGFSQMAAGSAVSALVGALYPWCGPVAVAAAMAVCALGALLVAGWARRGG